MKKRRFYSLWLPPILYCVLIFSLSQMSHPPIPPGISSNILHFPEFALLALLLARAIQGTTAHSNLFAVLGAAFLLALVVGALDEFHQAFVPGRLPDVHDWFRDGIGSIVGVAAWGAWQWFSSGPS